MNRRRTIETRDHQTRSDLLLQRFIVATTDLSIADAARAAGVPVVVVRLWRRRDRSLSPIWCTAVESWLTRQTSTTSAAPQPPTGLDNGQKRA